MKEIRWGELLKLKDRASHNFCIVTAGSARLSELEVLHCHPTRASPQRGVRKTAAMLPHRVSLPNLNLTRLIMTRNPDRTFRLLPPRLDHGRVNNSDARTGLAFQHFIVLFVAHACYGGSLCLLCYKCVMDEKDACECHADAIKVSRSSSVERNSTYCSIYYEVTRPTSLSICSK